MTLQFSQAGVTAKSFEEKFVLQFEWYLHILVVSHNQYAVHSNMVFTAY